ncbi:hypothetical protein A9Q74_10505 [Colwellia sp. 39_35_sub15_T18]|nr:hypothetical protein A9Q74_10505 [Colwellia sp. 39_35_sub15_T18]
MKSAKGFTIIELLVVMVIFSSLIASAYMSTAVYLQAVSKSKNYKELGYQRLSVITLIDKSIKSMSDYYVETDTYKSKMMVPYVKGTTTNLSYISHFSIFGFESDVIVQLNLLNKNNGTQIQISESPLTRNIVRRLSDINETDVSKVVLNIDELVTLSYLHRKPFNKDISLREIENDYQDVFYSTVERGLPKAVRLNYVSTGHSMTFLPFILNSRKAIKINSFFNNVEG